MSRDLPLFSGQPDEWFAFVNAYQFTTDLCGLTNHENLARLNKALIGNAREAVNPILGMPSNVPLIMDTLKMLFGRPNQIVKSMINKTRSLPDVQENRPETIIRFANSVNNLVSTMRSLETNGHMHDPALMEEILSKLPPSLQLKCCMVKDENDGLQVFSDWMMRLAMAASSMATVTDDYMLEPHSNVKYLGNKKESKGPCPSCRSRDHSLSKCHAFLASTMDERWNLVTSQSLCISCLQTGHQSVKCSKRKQCGVDGCTKPHHQLLHRVHSTSY